MDLAKESETCVENDNTEYAGFLGFKTNSSCESLNESIHSLHGRDSLQAIKLLEKKWITLNCGIERLSFLKRCRTGCIIPNFARTKHSLKKRYNGILSCASMDLIKKEIRKVRKQLYRLSK